MKIIFMFKRGGFRRDGRLRLSVAIIAAAILHVALLRFSPAPASAFSPRPRVSMEIVVAKKVEPLPPVAAAPTKKPRKLAPLAPVVASDPSPEPAPAVESPVIEAVVAQNDGGGVVVPVPSTGDGKGTASGPGDKKEIAPAGPNAAQVGVMIGQYGGWLRSRVEGLKHYPLQARRMHIQGVTSVTVRVNRDGQLACPPRVISSSHPILDNEAVRMVTQAAPFPPLPPGADETVEFTIPVSFMLTS
jgi:periplasmic protein TonB